MITDSAERSLPEASPPLHRGWRWPRRRPSGYAGHACVFGSIVAARRAVEGEAWRPRKGVDLSRSARMEPETERESDEFCDLGNG